ncbi:MAG: VirK/YbjX family protein [Campylobacteraceae bacterium]|jgi:uncharacterized protein VirK/YbjX|nr:VirK/YbjX family protein [Campylobacteraceae bacterium]
MSINTTLQYIGHDLYQTQILKERKRYVVFLLRCYFRKAEMGKLLDFFGATSEREQILRKTTSFVEQTTRSFFYKKSTYGERANIVKNHLTYLEQTLKYKALEAIYVKGEAISVWEESYGDKMLSLQLSFDAGQRKEGCLSLVLSLESKNGDERQRLYQIIFWLSPSPHDNSPSLWIGALQGSLDACDTIRELTKAFFGYRTKNLIFYGIRNVAKMLSCEHIYAVANGGYYAMNNIRIDRKLKTSLDEFWLECDGVRCEDKRFYEIPLDESRKSMEELKSQKRAQYKRRFEKLDEISAVIEQTLKVYIRGQ